MYKVIERGVTFIELVIGVLLPWKLRCRYSEFLMRLDGVTVVNITPNTIKEKDRFREFLHLGAFYAEEGNFEAAIENLKKALETSPDNNKARYIHLLLSRYYKTEGMLDKSIDEIVIWYKKYGKGHTHN